MTSPSSKSVWHTRDGRRIPVSDLEDAHLVAAIRMGVQAVRRRLHRDTVLGHTPMAGLDDGAQYFAELSLDDALERTLKLANVLALLRRTARFRPLLDEADRRGLGCARSTTRCRRSH